MGCPNSKPNTYELQNIEQSTQNNERLLVQETSINNSQSGTSNYGLWKTSSTFQNINSFCYNESTYKKRGINVQNNGYGEHFDNRSANNVASSFTAVHGEPILRPNSVCDYGETQLEMPVFRRHSFNDEFRRSQSSQESVVKNRGLPVRRRSLNDSGRAPFGKRYSRNSLSKFSRDDIVFQSNNSLKRNSQSYYESQYSRSYSENNVHDKVCSTGLKRNSWDEEYSNERPGSATSSGYGNRSKGSSEPDLNSDDDVGPCVKRRPLNDVCRGFPSGCDSYETNLIRRESSVSESSDNDDYIDLTNETVDDESYSKGDESFDILDILSFPSQWSSCLVDKTGFVDISFTTPEGRSVLKYFHRTSYSKLHIMAIVRIENPFLHSLYLLKKEEMESRNGHVNQLFLYHGTKEEHLSNILNNNLNWRLFSNKHRFGKGASFSPSAFYSSHYSDNTLKKVMLLFKVLVGNAEIGSDNMTIPPDVNRVVCDTSIKEDTSVIVKYSDNEFYPLYKIIYSKH